MELCVEDPVVLYSSRAPSASITESLVSVRHRILVCLVVADVVSPPDYSSVFM